MFYRLFGAKLHPTARIYPGVTTWAPWNLQIGEQSTVGPGATLYTQGIIAIGQRTTISQGVYLCTGTHDYTQPALPHITGRIDIGDDVWVAAEAFVHPNVHIADGVVVGARAVVTRDCPAWKICAGHPAKALKDREFNKNPG